jgi:hypothetical protein
MKARVTSLLQLLVVCGDPTVDTILAALGGTPEGMSRTDLSKPVRSAQAHRSRHRAIGETAGSFGG